jgi:uncharacterized protein YprB with RNaseH-like and TPR domain
VLDEEVRRRIESLRLVLLSEAQSRPNAYLEADAIPLETLEGVSETYSAGGGCLMFEKDISDYVSRRALADASLRLLGDGIDWPSTVFLDLETTGFSATPLFLAGTLFEREERLVVVQLLARDYSEERTLISSLDNLLRRFKHCVTFNGKSFDMPYIRERASYHRLELKANLQQFDLLHHARRMWKNKLPDCRLVTLEYYILGRRRAGDVAGWEVPCIYHEFVHTKDARRIREVLRHNLIDIVSMAELFICLAEAAGC